MSKIKNEGLAQDALCVKTAIDIVTYGNSGRQGLTFWWAP